eukprot:354372-Chlamydomonas_euryale.AAC.2
MAHGAWHTAHGIRHMVHGVWRVAYGEWHTAQGTWHMTHAPLPRPPPLPHAAFHPHNPPAPRRTRTAAARRLWPAGPHQAHADLHAKRIGWTHLPHVELHSGYV